MKIFAVIVDPVVADKVPMNEVLQKFGGGECHSMSNIWCIRSDKSMDYIYDVLLGTGGLANAAFMVIPVDGVWRAHPPARSALECWEFL
jgi:hypothetical protein